jgi:hypothetical protein
MEIATPFRLRPQWLAMTRKRLRDQKCLGTAGHRSSSFCFLSPTWERIEVRGNTKRKMKAAKK